MKGSKETLRKGLKAILEDPKSCPKVKEKAKELLEKQDSH